MKTTVAAVAVTALMLGACSDAASTSGAASARAPSARPTPPAAAYDLSGSQARRVAAAFRFFDELSKVHTHGAPSVALARAAVRRELAPHDVTVVDCDYESERSVVYAGPEEVHRWLRRAIADRLFLDVRRFWNANPDAAGSRMLGIDIYRRYSDRLRALGYVAIKVPDDGLVMFNRFGEIRYLALGGADACHPVRASS